MVPAKDISQWQGNWHDTGEPIVVCKMSGGDAGLYMDSKATENYEGAVASGRAVGGYHFIGWVMGAAQEASFFLRAMAPLAENDVYALDIENGQVAVPANAPAYVMEMVNYIHDRIGVWPLVYMNLSTLNAHDWSAVLANCGLWLADWAVSPNDNIPTTHAYVMQQYADGPVYDRDEWFGTVEQFKKYGYHAATPAPTTTTTTQAPTPEPTTTTTTQAQPEPTTTTTTTESVPTTTTTTTDVTPDPNPGVPAPGFWAGVLAGIGAFFAAILKFLQGDKSK